jgi:uroporphyrinogen decarboxylase
MDIAYLQSHYGRRLNFCGTMCVQTVLPHGTAAEVEAEVRRRQKLFPRGGLIFGPTHAIQVGTPLQNVLAMYRAAGSLTEKIDETILSIRGDEFPDQSNRAKLTKASDTGK